MTLFKNSKQIDKRAINTDKIYFTATPEVEEKSTEGEKF